MTDTASEAHDEFARGEQGFGELELETFKLGAENVVLRRLLWLRHDPAHYSALYGDDGEMQCPVCVIDFRRMPAVEIERFFGEMALQQFAKKIPLNSWP